MDKLFFSNTLLFIIETRYSNFCRIFLIKSQRVQIKTLYILLVLIPHKIIHKQSLYKLFGILLTNHIIYNIVSSQHYSFRLHKLHEKSENEKVLCQNLLQLEILERCEQMQIVLVLRNNHQVYDFFLTESIKMKFSWSFLHNFW